MTNNATMFLAQLFQKLRDGGALTEQERAFVAGFAAQAKAQCRLSLAAIADLMLTV